MDDSRSQGSETKLTTVDGNKYCYSSTRLRVAGLFAGIGGLELGLHRAGHETSLLADIDEACQRVLRVHFPEANIVGDVRNLDAISNVDVLAAGFPCQDLSQAGMTAGISGASSSIVKELFRLLANDGGRIWWVLLENVPFMLRLKRGQAIRHLVDRLEDLGFRWAYRTMDTMSFGLPHRRNRVFILASRSEDPRGVLFGDQDVADPSEADSVSAWGFYWTEGNRGHGLTPNGVPPLKSGSGLGIPSPPAIWLVEENSLVTPDIRDAERLQGLPSDWTLPAVDPKSPDRGVRWRLVGNAVSVPASTWIGMRLAYDTAQYEPLQPETRITRAGGWPPAAWGCQGKAFEVNATERPRLIAPPILDFLEHPTVPLSERATSGFLSRARASNLRFPEGFLDGVATHLAALQDQPLES